VRSCPSGAATPTADVAASSATPAVISVRERRVSRAAGYAFAAPLCQQSSGGAQPLERLGNIRVFVVQVDHKADVDPIVLADR
jgi:hypothetical protein